MTIQQCKVLQVQKDITLTSILLKNQIKIVLWIQKHNQIYMSSIDRQSPLLLLYQNDIEQCFKQLQNNTGDMSIHLINHQIVIRYQIIFNNEDNVMRQIKLQTKRYELYDHQNEYKSSQQYQKQQKVKDKQQQGEIDENVVKEKVYSSIRDMCSYYENTIKNLQNKIKNLQIAINNQEKVIQYFKNEVQRKEKTEKRDQQQAFLPMKIDCDENQGKYFKIKNLENWYANERKQQILILNKKKKLSEWYQSLKHKQCNKIILRMQLNLNKYHQNEQRYDIAFGLVQPSYLKSLKDNLSKVPQQFIPQSISIALFNYNIYANLLHLQPKISHEENIEDIDHLQIRLELMNNKEKGFILNRVLLFYNQETVYEYRIKQEDKWISMFQIESYVPFIYSYYSSRHFSIGGQHQ